MHTGLVIGSHLCKIMLISDVDAVSNLYQDESVLLTFSRDRDSSWHSKTPFSCTLPTTFLFSSAHRKSHCTVVKSLISDSHMSKICCHTNHEASRENLTRLHRAWRARNQAFFECRQDILDLIVSGHIVGYYFLLTALYVRVIE